MSSGKPLWPGSHLGNVPRIMQHFDVLIVGGGVVGSATAYYLQKLGFGGSIALIEKDTTYQFSCTARSAGGLRQQFSTPENIELSKFGLRLIRNLQQEFGPDADVGFQEQGYLILASPEGLPILEENHRIQIANGADNVHAQGRCSRRAVFPGSSATAWPAAASVSPAKAGSIPIR